MASFGETKTGFWEGCSQERRKFTTALRRLVQGLPDQGQAARARRIGVAPSTLSCYWSGRRVPSAVRLKGIYRTVIQHSPHQPPEELPALLELRLSAAARHQRMCRTASGGLPAPMPGRHQRADRRTPRNVRVQQALDLLAAQRIAGDRRGVLNTALSASRALPPALLAETVATLDSTGQADLAEAVALADRGRDQASAMHIALSLLDLGLDGYAQSVMRAALPLPPPDITA